MSLSVRHPDVDPLERPSEEDAIGLCHTTLGRQDILASSGRAAVTRLMKPVSSHSHR